MVWNTIGSFTLSFAQGKMFGATGLVIAMSGAISTGMSQLYFVAEKWVQDNTQHKTIYEYLMAQYNSLKERGPKIREGFDNMVQLAKDLWKVIYFCLKVITFPIWGTRNVLNWLDSHKPNTHHA